MSRPSTPMVKLKPHTHASLQEISQEENKPMGEIVGELVEGYKRERFGRGAAQDMARLKEDSASYKAYREESDEWDVTVGDGLERETPYPDSSR